MDMYLSAQDTLSLQEMLDCDYKTDFDSVLAGADLGLSLSGELPSLELDDSLGPGGDMTTWFTNGLLSANSNSSNSNFNLDLGGEAAALMVNPSSVMPLALVSLASSTPFIKQEPNDLITFTTTVACSSSNSVSYMRTLSATTSTPSPSPPCSVLQQPTETTVRMATTTTPSLSPSSNTTVPVLNSAKESQQQQQQQQPPPQKAKSLTHIQVLNNRILQQQANKKQITTNKHFSVASEMDYDEKPYPKPAYSYSCLIAMALKNSKTGSLPVSEIYNFMCEHFPYFKTAPNGWKNSVRHNLSLNKCFEKIEKPAVSGTSQQQRKGCLWAMNPAKIAKMDEEVQKWSKKDPMAIKKAMVNPGHLEMLERGEMKRDFSDLSGSLSNGQGSLSGTEDSDDAEDIVDVSSDPRTPTTNQPLVLPEFIDINNIALDKSFDESSLTEFDIEVAENFYDDLEDDKLNLGVTLQTSAAAASNHILSADFEPANKRSRLGESTIQGNYVYKPMENSNTSPSTVRRKTPILLRGSSGASPLIKLEES